MENPLKIIDELVRSFRYILEQKAKEKRGMEFRIGEGVKPGMESSTTTNVVGQPISQAPSISRENIFKKTEPKLSSQFYQNPLKTISNLTIGGGLRVNKAIDYEKRLMESGFPKETATKLAIDLTSAGAKIGVPGDYTSKILTSGVSEKLMTARERYDFVSKNAGKNGVITIPQRQVISDIISENMIVVGMGADAPLEAIGAEQASKMLVQLAKSQLTREDLIAITRGVMKNETKIKMYKALTSNPDFQKELIGIAKNEKIPLTQRVYDYLKPVYQKIFKQEAIPEETKMLTGKRVPKAVISKDTQPLAQEARDIGEQITKKYFSDTNKGILIVDDGTQAIEVVKIRVSKELQGKGIGEKMLNDLKSYANKTGKPIVLDSEPDVFTGTMTKNELNTFYEKNGFIKISKSEYPTTRQVVGQAYRYTPTQPSKAIEKPKIIINEIKPPERKITPASINKMIKPPAPMITKPEDVLLRAKLRTEAKGGKEGIAQYKKELNFAEQIEKVITREIEKPRAQQRSVISFVRQLGEFNQVPINEIKRELGIAKPLKDMNLGELLNFTTKLKERLKFKFQKGYQPSVVTKEKLNLKDSPKPKLTENDYIENRNIKKNTKTISIKGFKKGLGETLTPISTRLGNIDPSLKFAIRKFEFNIGRSVLKDTNSVLPYLKKIKKGIIGKLTKEDWADLDLALKNGDVKKINEVNKKYNIEKEYNVVRETLDNLYKRANEVGFDVGYQKDYFPRTIKDAGGLLEYFGKQEYWSIIDEAIKRKEMDIGRTLTIDERANLINTMIRGYRGGQITLSKTGAMKERVIDLVTPELNNFYYDSFTSLIKYVNEVNEKIEARRFFGKGNKIEGFNNTEDSIGAYTVDLMTKGKITPDQELELRNMLNARFNPRSTHGIVGLYKNLTYMDVMGSFLNAVTQLGDQAWAVYRGGLIKTIKGDIKSAFGKSNITKESLGVEASRMASEFTEPGKMSKAVNTLFQLTGLNKIDRLGKEALVNGAVEKYMKLAKKSPIDFLKKIDDIFGKESEQVLTDLKNGLITDNVKFLAFNELLDFHPVALSEMPEKYLVAGNYRIFYMLKSYTLKQFDIFRREAFDEMKKGNWMKGFRNLLSLATLVILFNGTADEIKDLLTNRKTSLKDRTIDQLAMLAGFSRYTVNRIGSSGIGTAIMEQITPATNLADNFSKDLMNLYKDFDESANINKLRTVQDIPLIGKFYYWWFGKGNDTETGQQSGFSPLTKQSGMPGISNKSLPPMPGINKMPGIKNATLPKMPGIK